MEEYRAALECHRWPVAVFEGRKTGLSQCAFVPRGLPPNGAVPKRWRLIKG